MADAWVKFVMRMFIELVAKWLTPEKIEEGKAKFVAMLYKLAKEQTPDFPFDEQLVAVVAKALGVELPKE